MEKCSSAITCNALTAVGLFTGSVTVAVGIALRHPALAIGGTCLAMTALAGIILLSVRTWITDVSAERCQLQLAARDLDTERTRYVAAQAALQEERGRMRADLASIQTQTRQELEREREALRQEFDDRRAELIRETFEEAVRMVRAGLLDTPEPRGTVVRFPAQGHPAERDRVRGRDVIR
ncbi:hypothetical protein ACFY8S_09325 [Streptomyces hygroscopicus]|uniref:hypothetical protein n=1 Tax=Streptomyces hygroscopicus TaxID=1912 RepID=UPI0036C6B792